MSTNNSLPLTLNRRTINTALLFLAVLHCCVWAFAFTESREFFAAETANLGSGVGPCYVQHQVVVGGSISYLQALDRASNTRSRLLYYAHRAQQVFQQSLDRTNQPPISNPQSVLSGAGRLTHTFSPQPTGACGSSSDEPAANAATEVYLF